MEGPFVDNDDGGSEDPRNRLRAIVGGTCLFHNNGPSHSSSSGFVKRLDGINLRGAPKRNRRCQSNTISNAISADYPKNDGVVGIDCRRPGCSAIAMRPSFL